MPRERVGIFSPAGPIAVEDIDKQRRRQAKITLDEIDEIRTVIDEKFSDSSSMQLLGEVFIGSRTKPVSGVDGKLEERVWTWGELMAAGDSLMAEQESGTRKHLSKDIRLGIEAQKRIYDRKRKDPKLLSDLNIAFTVILLERVIASKENITERYSITDTHVQREAELLERLRRLTLQPSNILLDLREDDEHEFVPKTEEQIKNDLSVRKRGEWDNVVVSQSTQIMDFLQDSRWYALRNALRYAEFLLDPAPRLTKDGKKVFKAPQIKREGVVAQKTMSLWRGFKRIKNFESVLPWLRRKFGKSADFETLLEALNGNLPKSFLEKATRKSK